MSDPQILEVCREEGVDFAQGYLIGKPVPDDQFLAGAVRRLTDDRALIAVGGLFYGGTASA